MIHYPNILIIRGTGRNVGKTLTACKIITELSKKHETVGIKISPHFHPLNGAQQIIMQSENFVVANEQDIASNKDSSRMLQAGAKKVYYIQAKNNLLTSALQPVLEAINSEVPVVIESGGLYDFIEPGLLLYVIGTEAKKKKAIRKNSNFIGLYNKDLRNYRWDLIQFNNGKFTFHD